MIISVEELRSYITTDATDAVLSSKLAALELLVRKYTNNNFQNRNIRYIADVDGAEICCPSTYFAAGDTIQISVSNLNNGLYTIEDVEQSKIIVAGSLYKEKAVLVTKVLYPTDIKIGVINMLKWDLDNRDKVGIQSESISRHSVTYFNMDGDNSMLGYPKSLCGFLQPYIKARF